MNNSQTSWRRAIKDHIVRWGINAICGSGLDVQPSVATEIPLGSAAARYLWLRILEVSGRKTIVSSSDLGHQFVCHVGDLAEFPYYHRRAHRRELILCALWLRRFDRPVVLDIGANTGFFVTQLAQMTRAAAPTFYAFEAVPKTFAKLSGSIQRLGLNHMIHPIEAPVMEHAREVWLESNQRNSLISRVLGDDEERRPGAIVAQATSVDVFCAAHHLAPSLLKIDVEGWEPAVIRGAGDVISRNRPAILFEHNPERGCAETAALFREGPLQDYELYYVDDLRGQLKPFCSMVEDVNELWWICNLLGIPAEFKQILVQVSAEARFKL